MCAGVAAAQPVPVVYDTDMGNDVDDALALAMLHALMSRGEIDLLAVTVTKDNRWSAPYVDAVNTFYGRGDIQIGVVRGGKTPEDNDMTRIPVELRGEEGDLLFPHDLMGGDEAPDAVEVLRRVLAQAADGSVVVIQVGFSTNLSRLLESEGDEHSPLDGRGLARRKVRLLSAMAGHFSDPNFKEYNVVTDVPAAQNVFHTWPTPVVMSGFEIGWEIKFPAYAIRRHFDYTPHHPVVAAYVNYMEMPYDRPSWDLTSVLFAVRPDERYFDLSVPGRVRVYENGTTSLAPDAEGDRRFLIADDVQRARVLEALIYLSSQPPDLRSAPGDYPAVHK
jgi:inosine-uridine nucleoside N-ribohydrolase